MIEVVAAQSKNYLHGRLKKLVLPDRTNYNLISIKEEKCMRDSTI